MQIQLSCETGAVLSLIPDVINHLHFMKRRSIRTFRHRAHPTRSRCCWSLFGEVSVVSHADATEHCLWDYSFASDSQHLSDLLSSLVQGGIIPSKVVRYSTHHMTETQQNHIKPMMLRSFCTKSHHFLYFSGHVAPTKLNNNPTLVRLSSQSLWSELPGDDHFMTRARSFMTLRDNPFGLTRARHAWPGAVLPRGVSSLRKLCEVHSILYALMTRQLSWQPTCTRSSVQPDIQPFTSNQHAEVRQCYTFTWITMGL